MRFRTWPVAALGLGSLLLLIAVSMLALSRKAQDIYAELDQLNAHHHDVEAKLRRLRSDVNLSGVFVRDYLLDVAQEHGPEYRQRLSELRDANRAALKDLRILIGPTETRIDSLHAKLDDYWNAFEPLFDWTPTEKILSSATFLRQEVVPRRDAVLAIAQEIEELNNTNLSAQQAEINRQYASFRSDMRGLLWRSLLLGLVVALTAVFRLRVLERRSEEQRALAREAEEQMRRLSGQLVAAQEEERRSLSRELHDHVAQVLTALRMELGRIGRHTAAGDVRLGAVAECRRLVDEMFRTVRDLSLGLRPSMLDDLGLQAALEWHVRDYIRRYGLDASLTLDGPLDELPDTHRICIYRAVQEAMTNCIRHAKAHAVKVRVVARPDHLECAVDDDGIGVGPGRRGDGLGLRGIEERVRQLGGWLTIQTAATGRGTSLAIRLPVPAPAVEGSLARTAG